VDKQKKVVLIMKGALGINTRPLKEAKALAKQGYSITTISWDCDQCAPEIVSPETFNYIEQIHFNLKVCPGIRALPCWLIWWCFIFFQLMVIKWDVAHAINFYSLPSVILAGKLKRKPIIYEIIDTIEDAIPLPQKLRDACIQIDKLFMRLATAVVLVDDLQIEELGGIPNSRVVIVYDSSPDSFNILGENNRKNDIFVLFFGGRLFSMNSLNMEKIFAAVKNIDDVKIIIAGYGDLVEEIKEWSSQMPTKIEFIGAISHEKVIQETIAADLLFVLRSATVLENKYISGSKMFEALMCGKPLLVNKGTSTAKKVAQANCGLVVDANNIEDLRAAILKLRDNPVLRKELGANARKAYEEQFSWHIMELRLIDLYQDILGEKSSSLAIN
jgi:glycosyltransferase involved in cell wall biosynthesis